MHYLKANENNLINMVGIRKKVSWSHWSMVNYQHFDCVKKERERRNEQGIFSTTDVYLQWLSHEWGLCRMPWYYPPNKVCAGCLDPYVKEFYLALRVCYIAAFYRCVFLMRLTWCDSLLKPFFFAVRGCTCRYSRNHRQLTSDGGQLGLLFVCEGIIWKFYQHLPNTFNRWHRLPIVLVLTDHSIKL